MIERVTNNVRSAAGLRIGCNTCRCAEKEKEEDLASDIHETKYFMAHPTGQCGLPVYPSRGSDNDKVIKGSNRFTVDERTSFAEEMAVNRFDPFRHFRHFIWSR